MVAFALTTMATTHTNMTTTATAGVYRGPAANWIKATVDFSTATYASNDTVQIVSVPAKATVLAVCYDVTTTNDAAATIDIGDDGSATRYVSSLDMGTAGPVCGYSAGYSYSAANTIDLHLDAAVTNGVLDVWVLVAEKP